MPSAVFATAYGSNGVYRYAAAVPAYRMTNWVPRFTAILYVKTAYRSLPADCAGKLAYRGSGEYTGNTVQR